DRRAIRAPCVTIARQPPWLSRGERPHIASGSSPRQPLSDTSAAIPNSQAKGQFVRTKRVLCGVSNGVTAGFNLRCLLCRGCVGSATERARLPAVSAHRRARRHALVPSLPAGFEREPRRRPDRQPQIDAARGARAADRCRYLCVVAAWLPGLEENRT